MLEYTYSVKMDDEVIACGMNIQTAILLVKALYNEYYNEAMLDITVSREEQKE